jgi:hydrogenase nickel incorporation protein HypA/HybF
MHELSIVEALIEQVQREVHRAGHGGKILRIELSIGRLSGVHCDSVRFAFDLLVPGTPVEGAQIVIFENKALCCCKTCNARTEIDNLVFQCSRCGGDEITIEGGRDLLLQSIDVEDQQQVQSG